MTASIKDKIKALLAKTTANGCTEAEAMAAAELAAKLMRRHQIEAADIELVVGDATEKTIRTVWRVNLARAIAICTNTAVIFIRSPDGNEIRFIGRAPGPEIALYLRDVCIRATDNAVKRFKKSDFYKSRRKASTRRLAVKDFVEAMVLRLRLRLLEIFGPLRDETVALEARSYRDRLYPDARTTKSKQWKPKYNSAVDMGFSSANDVSLNHGVSGTEGARLLS